MQVVVEPLAQGVQAFTGRGIDSEHSRDDKLGQGVGELGKNDVIAASVREATLDTGRHLDEALRGSGQHRVMFFRYGWIRSIPARIIFFSASLKSSTEPL